MRKRREANPFQDNRTEKEGRRKEECDEQETTKREDWFGG